MNLLQRFSLVCLFCLILLGLVFGITLTKSLEYFMLDETSRTMSSILADEFRHEFLPSDFVSPKTGREYELFSRRIRHLSFGKRVERIKVWDRKHTVLWSDTPELVGRQFQDNDELRKALTGEVVSDISDLNKTENILEKEHGRLLELYVPVSFDAGGSIPVVVEVYHNVKDLYRTIAAEKVKIWKYIILGFSFLYVALFGLVWQASRRLKRQNREITRSKERFEGLVRSARDGIVAMDGQGRIILINEAAEKIFRVRPQDVLGKSPADFLTENDRQNYAQLINTFQDCRDSSLFRDSYEIRALRADGEEFDLEGSLSCVGLGDDTMITAIVRDVSEKKAIMERLIHSEKLASVSLIAGSIGHEMNNILSSLLGYAELLRLEMPPSEDLIRTSTEVFSAQTQRLKLHANNLLALGKPQKPEMKPLAINESVEKVTDLLTISGMFKMCTIVKDYGQGLPKIRGDEMLLEQVMTNLEINAVHAMEKQGILTLSTAGTSDGAYVELSVGDTGHGMSENIRHQIFLPFFTTKEKGKGTGLGLYIVKQIVEQHQGYIRLESAEGKGTTMIIGLPVAGSAANGSGDQPSPGLPGAEADQAPLITGTSRTG
jgi:two-component system sporulation sensor kinase A